VATVECLLVGAAGQGRFIANQAPAGLPGWQRATLSISAQEPGSKDAIDAHRT